MKNLLFCSAAMLLLCSCISYKYEGRQEKPVASVREIKVFENSASIKPKYTVLGQAIVSGNYQEVSRDAMIDKLCREAAANGANAILIVEQQVIANESYNSGSPRFMTAFDYDNTNQNWREIYRDVDQNFTNTRRNSVRGSAASSNDFRRIIRAEFIKYNN